MMCIAEQLFDEGIRLDKIVWLAGATEGFTDDEFFEDVILDLDGEHPTMAALTGPEWAMEDEEAWLQWAQGDAGLTGFVVFASTPKPLSVNADGSYHTNSWGYTMSRRFYVQNPADAVPMAIAWRDEYLASQQAKAVTGGAA